MPTYAYRATNRTGRIETGVVEARSPKAAVEQIRSQGLFPIDLAEQEGKKNGAARRDRSGAAPLAKGRIGHGDVLDFTSNLASLLNAGLPLDRSLGLIAGMQRKQAMRDLIEDIFRDIQGGSSLADAIAKHPRVFSRLYVNMIRAGERGGVLELVLERLAGFIEATVELRQHVISAMIYPALMLFVGTSAVIFLMTYVLPAFEDLFKDMGQALPLPTQILMGTAAFLGGWGGLLLALALIGALVGLYQYRQTEEGRLVTDAWILRAPLFGDIVMKLEISRFARTLSTLLSSGVPILNALSIVRETIQNRVLSNDVIAVYGSVSEGGTIAAALREQGHFPDLLIHLVQVGEESGELDAMLAKVADRYEAAVNRGVRRLVSLLEPAMIILMAVVVGFVVSAVLMAIMGMNDLPL